MKKHTHGTFTLFNIKRNKIARGGAFKINGLRKKKKARGGYFGAQTNLIIINGESLVVKLKDIKTSNTLLKLKCFY